MASAAATIKFASDTKAYAAGLKNAEQSTQSFSDKAQKSAMLVAAAFTALVAKGYQLEIALDAQLRIIQNIVGLTDKQRQQVDDIVDKVSMASGASADQVAAATKNVLVFGKSVSETSKIVDDAGDISNSYGGSIDNIAKVLARSSHQWGISTDEVKLYGLEAANLANASLPDLLDRMGRLSIVGRSLNFSMADTAGALAAVGRQTRNVREAQSSLLMMFQELDDPDGAFNTKLLGYYGSTFSGLVATYGGLQGAVEKLISDFGEQGFINQFASTTSRLGAQALVAELDVVGQVSNLDLEQANKDYVRAVDSSTGSMQEAINSLRQTWADFQRDLSDVEKDSPVYGLVVALTDILNDESLRSTFQDLSQALGASVVPMSVLAQALAKVGGFEIGGVSTADLAAFALGGLLIKRTVGAASAVGASVGGRALGAGRRAVGAARDPFGISRGVSGMNAALNPATKTAAAGAGKAGMLGRLGIGGGAKAAAGTGAKLGARAAGSAIPGLAPVLWADFGFQMLTGDSFLFDTLPNAFMPGDPYENKRKQAAEVEARLKSNFQWNRAQVPSYEKGVVEKANDDFALWHQRNVAVMEGSVEAQEKYNEILEEANRQWRADLYAARMADWSDAVLDAREKTRLYNEAAGRAAIAMARLENAVEVRQRTFTENAPSLLRLEVEGYKESQRATGEADIRSRVISSFAGLDAAFGGSDDPYVGQFVNRWKIELDKIFSDAEMSPAEQAAYDKQLTILEAMLGGINRTASAVDDTAQSVESIDSKTMEPELLDRTYLVYSELNRRVAP